MEHMIFFAHFVFTFKNVIESQAWSPSLLTRVMLLWWNMFGHLIWWQHMCPSCWAYSCS